MADYLYRLHPTRPEMLTEGPTEAEQEATMDHFSYLKRGVDRRDVLLVGRTNTRDENTFGIVIFRAETDEAAQLFVDEDPVVQSGTMRAELFPFRLALLSDGWDR